MSEVRKEAIYRFLTQLAAHFEVLEKERLYLVNEAQARVTAIQSEKAELIAEAQDQLDKLNVLRVADSQEPLTLQQVRAVVAERPERFAR